MEEAGGWGAALRRRRAALLMAAAIPVLVLVGLPFSDSRWAPVAGFTSMWAVFILACDLLTATLLIVLHRQGEGSRLLVLACAYLWSGALMALVMVAVPGIVQDDPTFASRGPGLALDDPAPRAADHHRPRADAVVAVVAVPARDGAAALDAGAHGGRSRHSSSAPACCWSCC